MHQIIIAGSAAGFLMIAWLGRSLRGLLNEKHKLTGESSHLDLDVEMEGNAAAALPRQRHSALLQEMQQAEPEIDLDGTLLFGEPSFRGNVGAAVPKRKVLNIPRNELVFESVREGVQHEPIIGSAMLKGKYQVCEDFNALPDAYILG